ncbi:MAG: bifunctional tRNA (5-methylaminomethyl-2-thiouridine)(34)-methyltransferase MnmD/FAD-dependent 5-carboxymethylaminomethyl-2-thiouridine(34) oxidoreductase MnmC [Thiolinea sp.]
MQEITPAKPGQDDDGKIYAADFKDYYHSKLNAEAESRYVFLQGNRLPERWMGRENFVIAELGFGTGLNFFVTWQEWQKNNQNSVCLHYIAIEKHPFQAEDLRVFIEQWPELLPYADELLEQYPPLLAGMHRLELAGGRIALTLCFMDVSTALDEIVAQVDCWYLDGFAPAANPDMWSEQLMLKLAALSQSGATLATFTAAGVVRRNLQAAGFTVMKRKGFGRKREMLTAVFNAAQVKTLQPWFSLPGRISGTNTVNSEAGQRHAVVIGGGIAGCQTARALAERGWRVSLAERHAKLAQEASGNRAGVISPKMTAEPGWGEWFYRQAFLFAHRQLRRLKREYDDLDWSPCGALQLNHNERESSRWQALAMRNLPDAFIQLLDAEQAGAVAGVPLPFGGSYFPAGGWLSPQSLCDVLVRHKNIEVLTGTAVSEISRDNQQWRVSCEGAETLTADVVVIANGRDVVRFAGEAMLPFTPVRGQTSSAAVTPVTVGLKVTLGHEGYLTPAVGGRHIFGATFERDSPDASLSAQSDQQNRQQLALHLPELAEQFGQVESSHAAIRMTTPDRFPYVGCIPDVDYYLSAYADLRHGKLQQFYPEAAYIPGLYIMAGFGSRGLTTSGLCAALLAALIGGEPLPFGKSLYYQLHPSRFLIRRIRQNR